MGSALAVELAVGAVFFGLSAVFGLILAKYGAVSPYWEWLLFGCISSASMGVATLALLVAGRPNWGVGAMLAAATVNLGICLVVGGLIWFYSAQATDNDYMFFWVNIVDPKNAAAEMPVYIASPSHGSFRDLRVWWSPWGSQSKPHPKSLDNPYWSIGFQMKSPIDLVRGGADYGRSVPPGDYSIEYDATLKDVNYHFDEHLLIEKRNEILVQKIDVFRVSVPGGKQVKVYSGDSSKAPIQ